MHSALQIPLSHDRWPSRVEVFVSGSKVALATVEVANSFWRRLRGLLGRRQVPPEAGLLFVAGGSIHTLGMRFSIDIIFIDIDGRVLRIAEEVTPWRFVFAPRGTRSVLELNAGAARLAAIREHETLTMRECKRSMSCAPSSPHTI